MQFFNKVKNKKGLRIASHIVFWLVWWAFYFILIAGEQLVTVPDFFKEEKNTILTISPKTATANQEITIFFDPSKACNKGQSLHGLDTIYMHSAAFELEDIENWGTSNWGSYIVSYNDSPFDGIHQLPILTDTDKDGIYTITLTPKNFYNIPDNTTIIGIAIVFNGGDWTRVAKNNGPNGCTDFFITLNDELKSINKFQFKNYFFIAQITLFIIICAAIVSYFAVYFLFPRFLFTKRYWEMALLSFLTIVTSIWIETIYLSSLVIISLKSEAKIDPSVFDIYFLFTGTYFTVFFFITINLIKYWYQKQYSYQQLAKDKIEAELILLKSQLNPHFLFNSLNSIYGLALKNSKDVAKIILQLSELLDYLLYKSNQKFVELKQEIKLINDYLELEKLRYGNRLNLKYNITGKTSNLYIPPVLLLPFIENSFKHGVSKVRKNVWINVSITIKNTLLDFEIENSKMPNNENNKNTMGIGLNNIKKRLGLIYKNNYKLDILDKGSSFYIHLQIDLNNISNEG